MSVFLQATQMSLQVVLPNIRGTWVGARDAGGYFSLYLPALSSARAGRRTKEKTAGDKRGRRMEEHDGDETECL